MGVDPGGAGKSAPTLPRLTGAPLPPTFHRTIHEMADLRRLGIELGSEGAASALLGTLGTTHFARHFLDTHLPTGRVRPAPPYARMLTPAHPSAPSHSRTGLFREQARAFFINLTYRKHVRRQTSGLRWPRALWVPVLLHAGGRWRCAADARAVRAVACVCTLARKVSSSTVRALSDAILRSCACVRKDSDLHASFR